MIRKFSYKKLSAFLTVIVIFLCGCIGFLYCNFYARGLKYNNDIEYDADSISDINNIKMNNKPTIVVFGADYCPVCINYMPYVKEINRIYGDEITVKYVDTSVHVDIRKDYNIELIPSTLFFYGDGSVYIPTDEIEVDENEDEVDEREYISDQYTVVEKMYFKANNKFEYAIDRNQELAYCKYIGLLDMLQLEQIAEDLLKNNH